jgi:hypothetical protein
MKRLATIALLSAVAAFAACNKDSKKNQPAKTEAAAPTAPAPTPTAPAAGQAAAAAGQAAAAAGQAAAAAGQAADSAGQAAAAAGQAAAAAGQAAAAARALTDAEVETYGGRMLSVMDTVAKAVEANAADCAAMGTSLEKQLADNKAFMDEMDALESETNNAKLEAWAGRNMDKVKGLMERISTGTSKCAEDAKVAASMAKLME